MSVASAAPASPEIQAASSESLAARAVGGDREAFGELVRRHAGMVTGVAYSVLGDFAQSEDAGQEAFLEAWRKRSQLADPTRFLAWVCQIARNRAIDLHRRTQRKSEATAVGDLAFESSPDTTSAEDRAASEEERAIVWAALDDLPEPYRETMVLFYRGGESTAEVAASLGQTEPAVRKRLSRGRDLLRGEVEKIIAGTLRSTAPKAVFAAAVLGSLPTTASAASVGTAAAGGGKLSTTLLGGAIAGPLIGLLGAGLGTYASHQASPYRSQRRLLVWGFVALIGLMLAFGGLIFLLVAKQRSATPLSPSTYQTVLISVIVGFQLLLGLGCLLITRRYNALAKQAKADGEQPEPEFTRLAERSGSGTRYTSAATLLGLPLIDVRLAPSIAPVDADGRPAIPEAFRKPAKGWIAISGGRAVSPVLAFGTLPIAPIAIGAVPIGLLSIGGVAIGLVAFGGLSLGALSIGGLAIGGLAFGGGAIGLIASGGGAVGLYATGGGVWAKSGSVADAAAQPGLVGTLGRLMAGIEPSLMAFTEAIASPWGRAICIAMAIAPALLTIGKRKRLASGD